MKKRVYFVTFSRPDMPARASSYFGLQCRTAEEAINTAVALCMVAGDDEPEARRKHFSAIKTQPCWRVGFTPPLKQWRVSVDKS